MSQDDITRIRVGNVSVGIMGLKTVFEEVDEDYAERPEREAVDELVNRLGKRNYIPEKAREDYEKAFLREFEKFLGKPFEDDVPGVFEIKILGPGCEQCDRLEQELMQVLSETGIMADLEHVRDIKEIASYGVFGTPAIIVDGEVKSVGKIPTMDEIKAWIEKK